MATQAAGRAFQFGGHCESTLLFSSVSHLAKKLSNGACTLASVTTGCPSLSRSEGRTSMKTLSPVVPGLVCVPWKWILPVVDP